MRAWPRQAGDDRELQAADDRTGLLGNEDDITALRRDLVEGLPISGGQRVAGGFAGGAERVIRQQRDNCRHVIAARAADRDFVGLLHRHRASFKALLRKQSSFARLGPSRLEVLASPLGLLA